MFRSKADEGSAGLYRGHDTMWGGAGWDKLSGGSGDDVLHGVSGTDLLAGEDGRDSLFGGSGGDILWGGGGDDVLDGGSGGDFVDGGLGDDTVRFAGNRADYTISKVRVGNTDDGLVEKKVDFFLVKDTLTGHFDVLWNVEFLTFADEADVSVSEFGTPPANVTTGDPFDDIMATGPVTTWSTGREDTTRSYTMARKAITAS